MSWSVASVMTKDVMSVSPGTAYKEIVERLRERSVSAVPVIETDGRVVGIVSEADLLLKEERPASGPGGTLLHPHGDAARAQGRNAASIMTADVVTVGPGATLTEAARLMHGRGVKRLPVVDGEGRLVGIVSRADLLQPFLRSDESIAREVRADVLRRTLAVDPDSIAVTVTDGVVRLEGELETRSLCQIVERLVAAVEGLVGVDDRLTWRVDDRWVRPEPPPLALRYTADERE
jgi:CBS-domain-containing membrane protein